MFGNYPGQEARELGHLYLTSVSHWLKAAPENSGPAMHTDEGSSGVPRIALQQRYRCWPWKVELE